MDCKRDYSTCSVLDQQYREIHTPVVGEHLMTSDFTREIRAPKSCGNLRGSEDFLVCTHSRAVLPRTPYLLPRPRHGFTDYCDIDGNALMVVSVSHNFVPVPTCGVSMAAR